MGRPVGLGGYSGPSGGRMSTSMIGFYPWVGYQVNDKVSVWRVTGYGTGALSLTPGNAVALETGVSMAMSAVGTRGELVGSLDSWPPAGSRWRSRRTRCWSTRPAICSRARPAG